MLDGKSIHGCITPRLPSDAHLRCRSQMISRASIPGCLLRAARSWDSLGGHRRAPSLPHPSCVLLNMPMLWFCACCHHSLAYNRINYQSYGECLRLTRWCSSGRDDVHMRLGRALMVSLVALAGLMLLNGCASTVTSILEPEKYTVSGVVADDQGNPIEGVTIIYTGDTMTASLLLMVRGRLSDSSDPSKSSRGSGVRVSRNLLGW